MRTKLGTISSGGDLRSIGNSNSLVRQIQNQSDFDELFHCLFNANRLIVMRAADAIEKITIKNPEYLTGHKDELISLSKHNTEKEFKWHLALLLPRLYLTNQEFENVWHGLMTWAKDKTNSRIVRVNSLQGLFELTKQKSDYKIALNELLLELEKEYIPSISARIKIIKKQFAV